MKHIFIISTFILTAFFTIEAQSLKEAFINKDLSVLKSYIASKGVNTPDKGYYPIVVAAKTGDMETIKQLIAKGADIDARGYKKRTALMFAAQYNHKEIGMMLVKQKANLILKDLSGSTALDIAMKAGNKDFAEEVIRQNLASYAGTDGPYIFEEGGSYKAHYILPKSGTMQAQVESVSAQNISSHDFHCHDENGRTLFSFNVNAFEDIHPDIYDDSEAIFALSDIEGNLPALIKLLKAGNVMNSQFQWSFGKGHLVLIGDFFDRGDQVTECLWLIYKLEQEAKKSGGMVHFIIGNHEVMNLSGDIRFVRTKYKTNASMIGKSYNDMYSEKTILGRWLRTKPAMLRIRDLLFVHAGMSSSYLRHKLDIAIINETMMTSIDIPSERYNSTAAKALAKDGPLWSRAIAKNDVSASDLDAILNFYSAKTIIFGHSKIENIIAAQGGKVINLDVYHEKGEQHQQALLIESGSFYRVNTSGKKTKIK
jgi:hypothetical protein